jgi:hypothetical protein
VDVTDTTTVANPHVGSSTTTHATDVFIQANGGPNFILGGGSAAAATTAEIIPAKPTR